MKTKAQHCFLTVGGWRDTDALHSVQESTRLRLGAALKSYNTVIYYRRSYSKQSVFLLFEPFPEVTRPRQNHFQIEETGAKNGVS